nr:MAG TPA: hypothetical protein [Caudoviricetes sp.]
MDQSMGRSKADRDNGLDRVTELFSDCMGGH